jgi:hypothetical protein
MELMHLGIFKQNNMGASWGINEAQRNNFGKMISSTGQTGVRAG